MRLVRHVYAVFGAAAIFTVTASLASAAPINLIREDFSDNGAVGPTPPAVNWTTTGPFFESNAEPNHAAGRGLATTYDHDNNPSTPNINLPGGIEINGNTVNETVTINITMPGSFDPAPNNLGRLVFWAAVRANNATGSGVRIRDVTDSVDAVPTTTPTFASTNSNWQFNSFSFPLLASYAGDQFAVSFNGGGSTASNGLEVADITFAVNVPEPAALSVAGLAALGLLRRRRRA